MKVQQMQAGRLRFDPGVPAIALVMVVGLMLGGSAYAFSTMLVAFLAGIALGGRLGGPLADRNSTARSDSSAVGGRERMVKNAESPTTDDMVNMSQEIEMKIETKSSSESENQIHQPKVGNLSQA